MGDRLTQCPVSQVVLAAVFTSRITATLTGQDGLTCSVVVQPLASSLSTGRTCLRFTALYCQYISLVDELHLKAEAMTGLA